jgi:hypothetical protein
MTCFWDSLRAKLHIKKKMNNSKFIDYLKKVNKKQTSVLWNNSKLTQKQFEENYEHIKDFDKNTIHNGYDCSICDPFLILICDIYNVNIIHNYNGHKMIYTKCEHKCKNECINKCINTGTNNCNTLSFKSNTGHFS